MDILRDYITPSLEEIRHSVQKNNTFEITPELRLIGADSPLDSLAFVSFVVLLEEKILDKTGKSISIIDEKAFSQKNSPFQTVQSLSEFIAQRIQVHA